MTFQKRGKVLTLGFFIRKKNSKKQRAAGERLKRASYISLSLSAKKEVNQVGFYLCSSCANRVRCHIREDKDKLGQIMEQGDCPNYLFRSSTKYRSTFT